MGPICVAEHLSPFLPKHPIVPTGGKQGIEAIAAAPFGSASILLISWAYIKMLGGDGLSAASAAALLNANYMAHRLSGHYTLRYKHEQSSMEFVIKVSKLGGRTVINAIAVEVRFTLRSCQIYDRLTLFPD